MKKTALKNIVLAGDVGGTKTYLGLFERKRGKVLPVKTGRFLNSDYGSVEAVVDELLCSAGAEIKKSAVKAAVFGLACPVEKNRCELTNLKWTVDGGKIAGRFGFERVELMNDLVALACGVLFLEEGDLYAIQKGAPREGNSALIAAGTGLGEATLFWNGKKRAPSASEGGHADFAPRCGIEAELFGYLHERLGHVSYERVLSGQGLVNIYEFLKQSKKGRESEYLKDKFAQCRDPAEVIYLEAIDGGDQKCREALKMFVSIYGAEAGNLALRSMAVGGIYIGGGIAPKILKDADAQKNFLTAFTAKGRFTDFLLNVPVYMIRNDRAGLLGAACRASGLI